MSNKSVKNLSKTWSSLKAGQLFSFDHYYTLVFPTKEILRMAMHASSHSHSITPKMKPTNTWASAVINAAQWSIWFEWQAVLAKPRILSKNKMAMILVPGNLCKVLTLDGHEGWIVVPKFLETCIQLPATLK